VPFSVLAFKVSVMLEVAFVRSYSNQEPDTEVGVKPDTKPLPFVFTEPVAFKVWTKIVLIPPTESRHPRA
jgi:hypothetical protein